MGRYDDALALAAATGTTPDTANVWRYASRPGLGLNMEQQIVPNVGMFGRLGWADGDVEPYEFTDIDRTAPAGLSLSGKAWSRPDDTFGLAGVVNEISAEHIAYLNGTCLHRKHPMVPWNALGGPAPGQAGLLSQSANRRDHRQ